MDRAKCIEGLITIRRPEARRPSSGSKHGRWQLESLGRYVSDKRRASDNTAQSATMRQTHAAGEKLFVDFAGDTVPVIDPLNGDTRQVHILVAALGASNRRHLSENPALPGPRVARNVHVRRGWGTLPSRAEFRSDFHGLPEVAAG